MITTSAYATWDVRKKLEINGGGEGVERVGIGTRRGTVLGPLSQRGHVNSRWFLHVIPTPARSLSQKGIAARCTAAGPPGAVKGK